MTKTLIRWGVDDYRRMVEREPALRTTPERLALVALLNRAQKALPPRRRRSKWSILASTGGNVERTLRLIAEASGPPVETEPTPTPAPVVVPAPVEDEVVLPRRHYYRLNDWRALAHDPEVKAVVQGEGTPKSSRLYDALMGAQERQLPRYRWRTRLGWTNQLKVKDAQGLDLVGHLRDALLYPPLEDDAAPVPATPEPQPEPDVPAPIVTQPFEQPIALELVQPSARAAMHQLLDTFIATMNAQLQASAAIAFERTLKEAMPSLLKQHAAHVDTEVRRVVVELLGPPAAPQAAPQQEAPQQEALNGNGHAAPVVETTERPQVLAVDVVGMEGTNPQRVQDAFREEARLRLRFYDTDRAKKADLRDTVIMCTKFASHHVDTRIGKATNLIRVPGGVQSVIGALQQLLEVSHTPTMQ